MFATKRKSPPSVSPLLSDIKVLIVEDSRSCQKFAKQCFLRLGIPEDHIELAENGSEAVEKFKEASEMPYDLIYMDNSMPVMHGDEATTHIREFEASNRMKPSFIFTCSSDYEGFFPGANARLEKPFKLEALRCLLNQFERHYYAHPCRDSKSPKGYSHGTEFFVAAAAPRSSRRDTEPAAEESPRRSPTC